MVKNRSRKRTSDQAPPVGAQTGAPFFRPRFSPAYGGLPWPVSQPQFGAKASPKTAPKSPQNLEPKCVKTAFTWPAFGPPKCAHLRPGTRPESGHRPGARCVRNEDKPTFRPRFRARKMATIPGEGGPGLGLPRACFGGPRSSKIPSRGVRKHAPRGGNFYLLLGLLLGASGTSQNCMGRTQKSVAKTAPPSGHRLSVPKRAPLFFGLVSAPPTGVCPGLFPNPSSEQKRAQKQHQSHPKTLNQSA